MQPDQQKSARRPYLAVSLRVLPSVYVRCSKKKTDSPTAGPPPNLLIPEDRLREHGVDAFSAVNNLSYVQVHRGAEQHVGVVAWKTFR
jgi:hypothetical protein